MADRYLLETSSVDGYLLEDGSGVLLLEEEPTNRGGGVLRDRAKVVRWYQGDDVVTAATPLADDETGWMVYVPPKERARGLYLPDPEQVPAGSLFSSPALPDGEFIPTPIQPTPFLWIGQWQDEITTQPPSFTPVEEYWAQLPLPQKPPKNFIWRVEDERPTPVSFTPTEEDWRASLPPLYDPTVVVWAVEEDIVPQPAAGDMGGGVIKDEARVIRWYQGDDLPTPVTPLPFDEDYWVNLTPQPPTLSRWVGVDDDLIVPQPTPFIAEEYWAFPVPPWEKALVSGPNWDNADLFWIVEETEYQPPVFPPPIVNRVWASEEEIVPQPPLALFAGEDFWVILRAWEAPPFITSFSADDEIGDFTPPPVIQVVETDGVRRKKKKHPKEEISELVDKIVQERPTTPPEPRLELKGLAESEKYRIVPVYKPSIEVIPLSPPAVASEEEDDAEIVAYLVRIGML